MAPQSPSDSKTFAEPASHNLPVVVTPVPSRRSRRQAVWNNELGTQQQYSVPDRASHVPNVVLLNRNDNKCSPEAKPSVRRAVGNAETPDIRSLCRTDTYNYLKVSPTKREELAWLIEDSVSAFASSPEVEFFHGLSILSQLPQSVGTRSHCSADRLTSLCQALTHLLRLIRNRLNRYFDFFFRYRTQQGGFGCLSSNASASASKQDLSTSRAAEETSITTDTSSSPMELSDDPFAGAPASQVKFIFLAILSTSGAFACLQQLLLLIQAFSTSGVNNQRSAIALREVASLVGWTISSVAHLLIGPSNRRGPDGRALRDLRPGWTRELTALAEFSIYLASLLSPELTSEVDLAVCNPNGPSSPHNSCWWPPSLSAVLIIADQVMRIEGKEDNKKVEASAEGT
ncbi:unnamed protein product, partial [Dibothriocephalus latus]